LLTVNFLLLMRRGFAHHRCSRSHGRPTHHRCSRPHKRSTHRRCSQTAPCDAESCATDARKSHANHCSYHEHINALTVNFLSHMRRGLAHHRCSRPHGRPTHHRCTRPHKRSSHRRCSRPHGSHRDATFLPYTRCDGCTRVGHGLTALEYISKAAPKYFHK
jgi:hypothetical protein